MEREVGVLLGAGQAHEGGCDRAWGALGVGEEGGFGDDAGAAGEGDFGEEAEAFPWGGFDLGEGAGVWWVRRLMGLDGMSRDLLCAWVFILSRSKCCGMYVWFVVQVGRSGVCSGGVERPYIERVVEV